MCAIMGALIWNATAYQRLDSNRILNFIGDESFERGRDGWGYYVRDGLTVGHKNKSIIRSTGWETEHEFFSLNIFSPTKAMIGNFRAEPTTEFVRHKREYDQQPYSLNKWNIVHNGTIANDKELRTDEGATTGIDSVAIVEQLAAAGHISDSVHAKQIFKNTIEKLKGSYAILATHDDFPYLIFAACNYRPIWIAKREYGIFFASSKEYFPRDMTPQMLQPYSIWAFGPNDTERLDYVRLYGKKALVICSGGMDSVVAATEAKAQGYEIELVHFLYGSRAETPEVDAVRDVANYLSVPLHFIPMGIYRKEDSPLLQSDSKIAGGEAGAEFAHEWVPARNLVMLALATAFAEAREINTIVLGNNLEEAGAYPDNEPEFINRFNEMLPFAVGDGKRVQVIMPVGNLMKHEIVALGHSIGAPLHLTWSCYRAGPKHCGTCGPCYMRRTAFEINKIPEVIQYANSEEK